MSPPPSSVAPHGIHIHIHTYTHRHRHAHAHTHIHTHTHTHIDMHMHIQVSEATIAPEALDAIKTAAACGRPFDLFIADENYEPADVTTGTAAIRELRSYEAAHGLPRMAVILCTGNSEAIKSSDDGIFDLGWTKPFPKFADGTMQATVMAMFDRV